VAAKKQMTDTDPLHEEQVCIDLDETHDHGLRVPAQANEPRLVEREGADALSVAYQLIQTVTVPSGVGDEYAGELRTDAVALYKSIEPRDAIESVLARLLVGITNGAMASMGRAAANDVSPDAREIDMRTAVKCTLAATEISKALDNRRGQRSRNVTVGQVKVESGGQAIVGNVGARPRAEQSAEPPGETVPTVLVGRLNGESPD
jgi:hypothetical protein